ncbi:hypothetical protein PPTG_22885 [Phytophthora nicotianae INRA-310]|uniref:Uncharacterized protein n=2 Tax=Phytophthora nicotianae TaxID=4792 RepID=W2Q8L4_PHYN3|nr:hypothetical protein PPTG_22885 [Phytophthora nicotianae INRA-310]ETI47240.1 hypothetical protein F443_08529 [Phytophthora nicotianae P1569]ETN09502.1 hypothetical protein PPTG_22885 [Phytophthora nicotianae INRA-310]
MRYDYAWKETEFQQAEHRITGIGCRLLYLHASWVETYNHTTGSISSSGPRTKVFIEANDFSELADGKRSSCFVRAARVAASS